MRILVTGGAGYIGGVTAELLAERQHDVLVLDNLSQSSKAAVPAGAEFVQADLLDAAQTRSAFDRFRPDAVFHFAGHIQVGESTRNPLKYLDDNVRMGLNALRSCVDTGVGRFILSSTANLFDRPAKIPISEAELPIPGSPYGESKQYLERVLEWLDRLHGLRSACLRYFNAAGATARRGECHTPETHLIPLVLKAAQEPGRTVSIFGDDYPTPDGTCIRDYIHVRDLAQAHLLALGALDRGSATYNLGNGSGFSVKQVVEAARGITGKPIPISVGPRRPGDVPILVADSEKIRRELGWRPEIPELERIVETAWAWMKSHPDGYRPAAAP
jgi:UDP-glucose 4-epimerase